MNKNEITERLLSYYRPYGVTEEQIKEMVDTGIDAGIKPEIVVYNVFCQLAEEYTEASENDVFDRTAKMIGIIAEQLLAILAE